MQQKRLNYEIEPWSGERSDWSLFCNLIVIAILFCLRGIMKQIVK